LGFTSWGGARRGAGRKPKGERASVSHVARPALAARHPVHVTLRLRAGFPNLRRDPARRAIERVIACAADHLGARLVHYSIQTTHLHLVVEAGSRRALSRAMQGLEIRVAHALNRLWKRVGSIFGDRYHARILRTPREVRNVLVYVLHNARRHGLAIVGVDPCSSGAWFDGWTQKKPASERRASPCSRATTWLLRLGWRRHGLISRAESPATRVLSARRRSRARLNHEVESLEEADVARR
jgi:REP element-mobilizing transposase RayT